MKKTNEWIEVNVSSPEQEASNEDQSPHIELAVDNSIAHWNGIAYAELSVVLVHLRYLAMLYQTNHWIAKGDPFWGDHKLFAELYETVTDEVDVVAEKAVGLGSEANVNLQLQMSQLLKFCCGSKSLQTIPQSNELAKNCLVVEYRFLQVLSMATESMRACGTLTPGVENMLQQLFDTHEGHVYLLKRRSSIPALGM